MKPIAEEPVTVGSLVESGLFGNIKILLEDCDADNKTEKYEMIDIPVKGIDWKNDVKMLRFSMTKWWDMEVRLVTWSLNLVTWLCVPKGWRPGK